MNAPLTLFELSEHPRENEAGDNAHPYAKHNSPYHLINTIYPAVRFSNNPMNIRKNPAWNNYVPDMIHTINHGVNVAVVAIQIGARMGLSAHQLSYLFVSGVLHDVSKFEQDPTFLFKPDKLTKEEHNKDIKPHAERSAELVEAMTTKDINAYILKANETGRLSLPLFDPWDTNVPRRAAKIIRQHHEHFDGSGYPAGKEGEDILLLARIATVADVFAARIEEGRDYHRRMTPHQALDYMREKARAEFDPKILVELDHYVRTAYGFLPSNKHVNQTGREPYAPQEQPVRNQHEKRYILTPITVHGLQ